LLKLIHDKPWVGNIGIQTAIMDVTCGLLPPHIQALVLCHHPNGVVHDGALPHSLTKLHYQSLNMMPMNIFKMPSQLRDLAVDYIRHDHLVPGTLPSTLEKLFTNHYDLPLLPGLLPNGLKSLHLPEFEQKLQVGVLPQSLRELILER